MICPSCGRHYDPPGPCVNINAGEVCAFRDPDPDDDARVREILDPPFDPFAAVERVESSPEARAEARAELAAAVQRKAG